MSSFSHLFVAPIIKLSCVLTGDNYPVLARLEDPESEKRIQLLAMSLLLPVLLWFITIFLVCTKLFHVSLLESIAYAMIVGLVIFIVERIVIMADGDWKVGLARFVLALCLAALGSFLLDEILFEQDISNKIEEVRKGKDLNKFKLEQETLRADVEEAQAREDLMRANVVKEATGLGSGFKGAGSATRAIEKQASLAAESRKQAQQKLDDFESNAAIEQKSKKSQSENHGFIERFEALWDLIKESFAVQLVFGCLTVAMLIIEMLPVIAKMFNGKNKTAYERRSLRQKYSENLV
jgi:hypothetical protein